MPIGYFIWIEWRRTTWSNRIPGVWRAEDMTSASRYSHPAIDGDRAVSGSQGRPNFRHMRFPFCRIGLIWVEAPEAVLSASRTDQCPDARVDRARGRGRDSAEQPRSIEEAVDFLGASAQRLLTNVGPDHPGDAHRHGTRLSAR